MVLLDTSAVVAFARESISVGEILAEIADEAEVTGTPGAFGVSVASLAQAAQVADSGRLELLVRRPGCHVLELHAKDWRPLSLAIHVVGRLDLAAVLLAATRYGQPHVLSAEPDSYAPAGDAITVIAV
jgi:hypothetical protein